MAIATTIATPPLFHVMYVKGVLAARAELAAEERAAKFAASGILDSAPAPEDMHREDSFVFTEAHRVARGSNADEDVINMGRRQSSGV